MTRVLILDDDLDLRALVRSALTARGVEVLEAGLASEATRLLAEQAIDLVVVDWNLPDGCGIELVERLRATDRAIRVVFLSAFIRDLDSFRRRVAELDVARVVAKPIEPAGFAAELVGLLGPAGPAAAPTPPAVLDPLVAALAALRRTYAERLPERVSELERAIDDARADVAALGEARTLAHRLRGSAGSYGFAALGAACGVVEDLMIAAASDPTRWPEIAAAMRDARRAAPEVSP